MATAAQVYQRDQKPQLSEVERLKQALIRMEQNKESYRGKAARREVRIAELTKALNELTRENARLNRELYQLQTGKSPIKTMIRESKMNREDFDGGWQPEVDSPAYLHQLGHQATDGGAE